MQAPRLLTVTQPWAWAITTGIQPILSRYWADGTRFTGPVLIHASRTHFDLDGSRWLTDQGYEVPRELNRGVIVGRVYLACCVSTELVRRVLGASRQAWIDTTPGAWHLVFTDPEAAPHPIAVHGAQNNGLVAAPRGWRNAFTDKQGVPSRD